MSQLERTRGQGAREPAHTRSWAVTAALLGASALAAGCATTSEKNIPTEELTRADAAITESIDHGARETAAAELAAAEQHLEKAQAAADDKQYDLALLYAEKAEADAKLAEARAERASATATLEELQDSIRVLKEEIDRQLQERSEDQS